jgi:hypothetical protein
MRNTFVRYGKRWPIPSTVQIMHELRAFSAEEDVREECAAKEGLPIAAGWDEIYAHRTAAAAAT